LSNTLNGFPQRFSEEVGTYVYDLASSHLDPTFVPIHLKFINTTL
jgi:hypothetical protein